MSFEKSEVEFLNKQASIIRKDIVEMTYNAGTGHPGGSLSAADIVTVLYYHVLRIEPKNPKWPNRDRFVLSKGHACPVLYAALAEKGYFDRSILKTLRKFHSILQGHPDMNKCPGIDMTSGSLGNGLSTGLGMALAGRANRQDYKVYVMLGDGEIQEGVVWEAAMAANHYKVKNLIAIVDNNGLQVDGFTKDIMSVLPIDEKFKAFGWKTVIVDGHDIKALLNMFDSLEEGPIAIIADTVKGKGVSFMENKCEWHGTAPSLDQAKQALYEIGAIE